ncbi:MAG: hypothetical protein Q9218_001410 [Villophora microphyllina]
MSEEQNFVTEFNKVTQDYWRTHAEYDVVNALLLRWVEDDLNVEPEVSRLQQLFRDDFHYGTHVYSIPSKYPELELRIQLDSFIKTHSLEQRSLTILYYAGHADDADHSSEPGYSEWRAKEEGGPTLNWFWIQPVLYQAQGDVLVILDCCHATLKTRGAKDGKMEILAACGSGSRVPKPGRLSFTSVLIRLIRKCLKSGQTVGVYTTPGRVEVELIYPGVPPIHFTLSKEDLPSIILKPIRARTPDGYTRREQGISSFVLLTVSLRDDPTGLEIANWLKSFSPEVVKGVDVEALVLKARRLENLSSHELFFPGAILGKLSEPVQKEILSRLWGLSTAVSNTAKVVADATTATLTNDSMVALAKNIVTDIQEHVAGVCESVETGVVLDSNTDLEQALHDAVTATIGAKDTINLRQYLLDTSHVPTTDEIPKGSVTWSIIQHAGLKPRFRYGRYLEKAVVVESFSYTPTSVGTAAASERTTWQVKRIAEQLSLPKRTSFHILPCLGYIHEEFDNRFGLVFEDYTDHSHMKAPVSLRDVYTLRERVPLGERIQLAYSLGKVIEQLHLVGWLHKEWKSPNIFFFPGHLPKDAGSKLQATSNAETLDLASPWLFGFETSRHEDDDSDLKTDYTTANNAYRHPERWGKPDVKFEKAHDVYALGIMCIEIAFWREIMHFKEMKVPTLDPWAIKQSLLDRNDKDIPHLVGQGFNDAIDVCLRFKELTEGLDELAANRTFKTQVLAPLEKAAKLV